MAELKTKRNTASVGAFLKRIEDPERRRACLAVKRMMQQVTRSKATMWGSSIVGFGTYRYRLPNGKLAEWMLTGFSPRKKNLTLYIMAGFGFDKALMRQLGTYTTAKACLYIKRLEDVDATVLHKLIRRSVQRMKQRSA